MSRVSLLCAALALGGCAVGATLPFGGGSPTYFGPGTIARNAPAPGAPAAATDEDAPDEDRTPQMQCVRDTAGPDFARAIGLRPGQTRGCLERSATDVYTLTAGANPGGTMFEVRLSAKVTTCAKLFDQDRKGVTASECAWGANSETLWAAVAPNTKVYLRLERSNDVVSPYVLDVRERAIVDFEEPNNSWKKATRLELGSEHQALLQALVNDDVETSDLYRIEVKKGGTYSFVVDPNADDVQPEVTIYDADRKKLEHGEAANRGAILREQVSLRPGTYYVEVSEAGWGIGYGNGPAGSDSHGSAKPTAHFSKPYSLTVSPAKRVSGR